MADWKGNKITGRVIDPRALGMGGKYAQTGRNITSDVEHAGTAVGNAVVKGIQFLGKAFGTLVGDPDVNLYPKHPQVNITNPELRKRRKR